MKSLVVGIVLVCLCGCVAEVADNVSNDTSTSDVVTDNSFAFYPHDNFNPCDTVYVAVKSTNNKNIVLCNTHPEVDDGDPADKTKLNKFDEVVNKMLIER